MKSVNLKITELRKLKGVTQTELAHHLGVSFQSISKWECGTTMPDITLLPTIADYFEVSVDELLGLKPLSKEPYHPSQSDTKDYWGKDREIAYLKRTRDSFWNDDYLEFLVEKVWKIVTPINVVDFGCGYGFLGLKLLPLLPDGSTYTGIDINSNLIKEARSIFAQKPYKSEFIECDLYDYDVTQKYDMAICQAVLRHMSEPYEILQKMTRSVLNNGLVICVENNREFEQAGLLISELEYNPIGITNVWQQLWKSELQNQGRDYAFGMKIPFFMSELGLHDIDIRINDKMNFICPEKDNYKELLDDFLKSKNLDNALTDDKIENLLSHFMNRGVSRSELQPYIENQLEAQQYLDNNMDNALVLQTFGTFISFGRK